MAECISVAMAEEQVASLLAAAGDGNRDAVAEMLDAQCDVNAVDGEGWSALILASKVCYARSARSPPEPDARGEGVRRSRLMMRETGRQHGHGRLPARARRGAQPVGGRAHGAPRREHLRARARRAEVARGAGGPKHEQVGAFTACVLRASESPHPAVRSSVHASVRPCICPSMHVRERGSQCGWVLAKCVPSPYLGAPSHFCASLFGRTPLMGAAMNKHPPLIRVLLEAKVLAFLASAHVACLRACKRRAPFAVRAADNERDLLPSLCRRMPQRRTTTAKQRWIWRSRATVLRQWSC